MRELTLNGKPKYDQVCQRCGMPIRIRQADGRWRAFNRDDHQLHYPRCLQRQETKEVIAAQQRRWKRQGRL